MRSALPQTSVKAVPGKGERIAGTVILLALAAIVAAYLLHFRSIEEPTLGGAGPTSGGPSGKAFPDPLLAGWSPPTDLTQYASENLHLKIDGRADFFLEHGVIDLLFGSYRHRQNTDRTVDVYWYTMSTAGGASDVYLAEKPPNVKTLAFVEEGYVSGGAVFFREGVHYVQVLPTSTDDDSKEAAYAIAKCIAGAINGAAH